MRWMCDDGPLAGKRGSSLIETEFLKFKCYDYIKKKFPDYHNFKYIVYKYHKKLGPVRLYKMYGGIK